MCWSLTGSPCPVEGPWVCAEELQADRAGHANYLKPRSGPHGISSPVSVLFDTQPWVLGFSVQCSAHLLVLLMVIMATQYSPSLFIWKVHRIKPKLGLKKVKQQPSPDPLLFTHPVIPKELEWYVTISA